MSKSQRYTFVVAGLGAFILSLFLLATLLQSANAAGRSTKQNNPAVPSSMLVPDAPGDEA